MNENTGFDPFADTNDTRPTAETTPKTTAETTADEAMDHLLATDGNDGWEPIAEEAWQPNAPIGELESLILDGPDPVPVRSQEPAELEKPRHHNPLPGQAAAEVERPPVEAPDYSSNEAILQRSVLPPAESEQGVRRRLPSRTDAPSVPILIESRPMSWILPAVVGVSGIGAGVYVFANSNPILGGIAISLSVVGSLFLRALLRQ